MDELMTRADHVDGILAQWRRERPEVDVAGMAIIGRLSRLEKMIGARLAEVFALHGLKTWEFDVLASLRRSGAPYRLTAGELLGATMVTSGAMTNRIDRLEQRGLVRRERGASDGRQVLVTLTDEGLATVDAALVDHAANELDIVSVLDDAQQEALVRLLRRLHHALAAPPDVARDDQRPVSVTQLRLVVEATDFDRALAFYRDTLGLAVEFDVESEEDARVVALRAGRATLEIVNPPQRRLIDRLEVGREGIAPRIRVAFEVTDVERGTDHAVTGGATLVAAPTETPWRSLNSRLDAPADLHLTLFEELGPDGDG